jgi:MFS family permease
MDHDRIWGRNFISICLSALFVYLTFYTLVATLPVYAVHTFNANNTQVGLILTVFVIAALVSRPMAGPWMKKFGAKKVFLAAAMLFLVASSLYLASNTLWFLLGLRVVQGFAFGIATSSAGTIAAYVVPKGRTGEGLGYFAMFMSLAMVFGPFIGLTLIQHAPFPVLFLCCAVFSLLSFVCGLLVQVPSLESPTQSTAESTGKQATGLLTLFEPSAIPIALCGFLVAFAYGGISGFVSVYGNGLGLTKITNYFFAVYALMVVLPRPLLGRLFDRVGANAVVYPGIVLYVIGQWFLSQADTGLGYLGSAAVIGLGYGALFPSFQALAVQAAPYHRKGYATSTYLFFYDAGIGVGSLLLGMVAGQGNYGRMYVVSAIVAAFTVLLFFLLHHRPSTVRSAMRSGTPNEVASLEEAVPGNP